MQLDTRKARKGFTLVELLVVIAIIGLLSSVVFASLDGARKKARDAHREATIDSIQKGLEFYFDEFGQYPSITENECGGTEGYTTSNNDFMKSLVDNNFLAQYPVDPLGRNCNMQYAATNARDGYAIFVRWESKPKGGCNPNGGNHINGGWSCVGINQSPSW